LTLIQAVVPSADEVVTQGDVHEEIDLLCNLNVEDLNEATPQNLKYSKGPKNPTVHKT
jgi:hypothetical protein